MNGGYQNEKDFVNLFNKKYLYELDNKAQDLLKDLFENEIDNSEPIKAWKNKAVQKADIFIKYKNYIKGISIKSGHNNSIHHEQIQEFERYLAKLKIPYKVIIMGMKKRHEWGAFHLERVSQLSTSLFQQRKSTYNLPLLLIICHVLSVYGIDFS